MKKIISIMLLCAAVLFTACKKTVPVVVTDVKINKDMLSLVIGTKGALVATVNPKDADDKSVTWSSSDVAVAIVSVNGEVSALKVGVATITVTSNSDKTKKATCNLTVTATAVKATGVILDKKTVSVAMGLTVSLVPTVAPATATNQEVTWASSDVAVATISAAGVVTPVKVGTAKITVKTKDGDFTAVCDVTVTAAIKATGVTLDKATVSVEMGKTSTLVSTIAPANTTNQNVAWTSSDVAVATVSAAGVVTPVKVGTAKITVKTKDGNFTAVCDVTVTAAVVAVTSVTLDKATVSVAMGATSTLIPTVLPATATDKTIIWKSSDVAVATVSAAGVVTPVKAGTATITATSNADGTKIGTCAVTVTAI